MIRWVRGIGTVEAGVIRRRLGRDSVEAMNKVDARRGVSWGHECGQGRVDILLRPWMWWGRARSLSRSWTRLRTGKTYVEAVNAVEAMWRVCWGGECSWGCVGSLLRPWTQPRLGREMVEAVNVSKARQGDSSDRAGKWLGPWMKLRPGNSSSSCGKHKNISFNAKKGWMKCINHSTNTRPVCWTFLRYHLVGWYVCSESSPFRCHLNVQQTRHYCILPTKVHLNETNSGCMGAIFIT